MKQQDPKKLEKSAEIIAEMEQLRNGPALDFQKRMANDPTLIRTFVDQYKNCNTEDIKIPRKYREMMMMAIGCATGTKTTIITHGNLAIKHGATLEEMAEAMRIVFFLCGTTAVIPATELFEMPEWNKEGSNEE